MKIKMKALASGPGGVFLTGQVYISPRDLSDEQAGAFVEGGYAEEITDQTPVESVIETADAPVEIVEKAVPPRTRSKAHKE